MKKSVEHRKCAGVIALKRCGEAWQVLLLFHSSGHYWGFPKGHIEDNESKLAAAKRELFEETSLTFRCLIQDEPYEETFRFAHEGLEIEKHVTYFLAEVEGELFVDGREIIEGRFVSFDEAEELVSFESNKKMIGLVQEVLKNGR